MSKFTKTLTASALALAVSGLTTGTAFALSDIVFDDDNATSVQLDIKGCDKEKTDGLDTVLEIAETDFQQGEWILTLFQFNNLVSTSGVYIESKPGKTLTLMIDEASEGLLLGFLEGAVKGGGCGTFNADSMEISKLTVKIKDKKGIITGKFDMQLDADYQTADKNKTKKIKLNIKTDNMTGSDASGTD
jgi:hypothetical protein